MNSVPKKQCNISLQNVLWRYEKYLGDAAPVDLEKDVSINLKNILARLQAFNLPRLYVIIDEYDNFANQ